MPVLFLLLCHKQAVYFLRFSGIPIVLKEEREMVTDPLGGNSVYSIL